MPVTVNEVKYRKSKVVSDGDSNGGVKGQALVVSGVRHALFPRVTKAERTNGVTRFRKEFWCNENSSNEIAYGVLQWLETLSNGDDRFYLAEGTQDDVQLGITDPTDGSVRLFTGAGQLSVELAGAETEVSLDMESNDYVFVSGSLLHIASKVKTSQTVDVDVIEGDSITDSGGSWSRITSTSDIIYPNGVYLGDSKVLTIDSLTTEEWLTIATKETADEVIGVGTGATLSPVLSTLTNNTNGIHQAIGKLPVITTIDTTDTAMSVYINPDGTVDTDSSDATGGELNMVTGAWVTDITWSSEPKNTENILITYYENPYSWTGNTVTIELDDTVGNAYAVANTIAGGCIYTDEVVSSYDSWVKTSGSGTYDDTTYPVLPNNEGAEEDTITITFTTSSVFSVSGLRLGSLGTGFGIGSNCEPLNPFNGKKMFNLRSAGWGGTWAIGDSIVFDLHPSAQAIWLKEVVPSGTVQEPNNLVVLGWYSE